MGTLSGKEKSRPAGARGLKLFSPVMNVTVGLSRPAGARGLKYFLATRLASTEMVASRRGAWIEINNANNQTPINKSRPAGARGLKLGNYPYLSQMLESRPAGARGLKFLLSSNIERDKYVASRRGAWIEIRKVFKSGGIVSSRVPQGRVD